MAKRDIDYCIGNGANYYVIKPSNFNDLRNLVADTCKRKVIKKIISWERNKNLLNENN